MTSEKSLFIKGIEYFIIITNNEVLMADSLFLRNENYFLKDKKVKCN
jgi:hypothetical protein